jgi:hypothetical protein
MTLQWSTMVNTTYLPAGIESAAAEDADLFDLDYGDSAS